MPPAHLSAAIVAPDDQHLFIYGTLMPSAPGRLGRARREKLRAECVSLGPAIMAGRLYDLGSYPGATDSEDASDRIHGEVVRLIVPEAVFAWLDPYEGLMSDGRNRFNFERVSRPVLLATGGRLEAWTYLYCGVPPEGSRRIDGHWIKI